MQFWFLQFRDPDDPGGRFERTYSIPIPVWLARLLKPGEPPVPGRQPRIVINLTQEPR
jgi:hypothetical protein